jgi:hypothetical protein
MRFIPGQGLEIIHFKGMRHQFIDDIGLVFFSLLEIRITCTSSDTLPLNLGGIWIIPFLIFVWNSIVCMVHLMM